MSFLKKIARFFSTTAQTDDSSYWIEASCLRCGEVIRARVDLRNDLSIDYGENGTSPSYHCRKVLIGESGRCFQRIEVEMTFDANRRLISQEVTGGQLIKI